MVRDREKLSPPHALPRTSSHSLAPSSARLRARFAAGRRRRSHAPLIGLGAIVLALATAAGCGRSELIELQEDEGAVSEFSIDYSRELTLTDENIVLIELVAPATPEVRVAVIELEDGIPLEEVIHTICPDDEPEIVLDATGSSPEMRVYRDGELRGIIWM
jgi:hypothetical protein